ncbi:Histidine kinase A [Pelomyxa schiedti]|nr:Histidine kinase A [Pelomyxa schiedti]
MSHGHARRTSSPSTPTHAPLLSPPPTPTTPPPSPLAPSSPSWPAADADGGDGDPALPSLPFQPAFSLSAAASSSSGRAQPPHRRISGTRTISLTSLSSAQQQHNNNNHNSQHPHSPGGGSSLSSAHCSSSTNFGSFGGGGYGGGNGNGSNIPSSPCSTSTGRGGNGLSARGIEALARIAAAKGVYTQNPTLDNLRTYADTLAASKHHPEYDVQRQVVLDGDALKQSILLRNHLFNPFLDPPVSLNESIPKGRRLPPPPPHSFYHLQMKKSTSDESQSGYITGKGEGAVSAYSDDLGTRRGNYAADDEEGDSVPSGGEDNAENTPELRDENIPSNHRRWYDEYQEALEMPFNEPQDRLIRSNRIRDIALAFVECALEKGRTIITEAFLPPSKQTIKPLTSTTGVAGGAKYLIDGIFFKFATDLHGLYGGDEFAMKAAGHELLSITEILNCNIPKLCVPLVALIDFCGFRLIATSELPIDPGTLEYGSADGGKTVHSRDSEIAVKMEQVGRILNLKAHKVGPTDNMKVLHGPCDIEVHRAHDGRIYVLDAARLCPPEPPLEGCKGAHLYRLLRPELVKCSPTPLCSDAFTPFGRDQRDEHDKEVKAAHDKLLREIIPKFAIRINQKVKKYVGQSVVQIFEQLQLIDEMHREGINLRHLYLLKKSDNIVLDVRLAQIINTEIIFRKIKNRLREFMRCQLKRTAMNPPKRKHSDHYVDVAEIANLLNTLICCSIIQSLTTEGINVQLLLLRLQSTVMKFSKDVIAHVTEGALLSPEDFTITPRVKHTNTVPYEEGVALYQQARLLPHHNADILLQAAAEKFQQALQTTPDDYRILTHFGILLVERAKYQVDDKKEELFKAAIEKFKSATKIKRNDYYTLFHWADTLKQWAAHLTSAPQHNTTQPGEGSLQVAPSSPSTSPSTTPVQPVDQPNSDSIPGPGTINGPPNKESPTAALLLAQAEEKLKEANLFGKRWFWNTLETNGAKSIFDNKPPGTFFIRSSNSRPGLFVLSFTPLQATERRVRNVLIEETADGRYFLSSESTQYYDTLEDLVIAKVREGYEPILREWI